MSAGEYLNIASVIAVLIGVAFVFYVAWRG